MTDNPAWLQFWRAIASSDGAKDGEESVAPALRGERGIKLARCKYDLLQQVFRLHTEGAGDGFQRF